MRIFAAALLLALGLLPRAEAETYPQHPIRLVVPFAPGGSTDVMARLVAHELSAVLGQTVLVDNRAGGATNIGADLVAKAPADGYTLLMGTTTQAINTSLFEKLPYDLEKDFSPVAGIASSPSVLVVNPGVPVHSVAELVARAKAEPGTLAYASSGNGSTAHLAGELFKTSTGVELLHVPYKGAGPALADVVSGQVQMMFGFTAGALPFIKSGQLRPLAVTSRARLPDWPDMPTMEEAGISGYEVSVWYGVLAPAGTPREIVDRLAAETTKAVKGLDAKFEEFGAYPLATTPEGFAAFIHDEIRKWADIVKRAGARID
jgi:tripartite-type tricarboxylate transporter receptor subunit TctC